MRPLQEEEKDEKKQKQIGMTARFLTIEINKLAHTLKLRSVSNC